MKNLLMCFVSVCFNNVFAQLYVNGADFIITTSGVVYVNDDSLIVDNNAQFLQNGFLRVDKDLINQSGGFVNDGDVYVYNNIILNDQIQGLSNLSNFYISGDWINNDVFTAGLSTVTLNGNLQEIRGNAITDFYNLTALGALSDKKSLVNVDANVLNIFNLGEVEFSTEENTLSILNTNTNSIQRLDGFVSSLGLGRLERSTNALLDYLFPVGSSIGTIRYRPIVLTPNANTPNNFGVRLANINPSLENFDIAQLSDSLCEVNPNFFHRLYSDAGSADITMNYISILDGDWGNMASWQQSNLWNKTVNENLGNVANFSTVTALNISDFSESAFALANRKPTLTLEEEITINAGASVDVFPVYSGATPLNVIWTPNNTLSCSSCLEPNASPAQTTLYALELEAFTNCILRDSILIRVTPVSLLFPTAFSPNIDGVNETFRPIGSNIESYRINIYNRWGEQVYSSNDHVVGWDGTYKNRKAPVDVYAYSVQYKFLNIDDTKHYSSTFTLIR
jgi:gliding motility-associated-like protein